MIDVEALLREVDARARMNGNTLYPFQRDGIRWLLREPPNSLSTSKLLADDMGLGKTVQAVGATIPRAPVLVVSPSSVKWAWAKTYRLWRPEFTSRVVPDRQAFRWPRPSEVLVANFEQLPVSRREVDALIHSLCEMSGIKTKAVRLWDASDRASATKSLRLSGASKQFPREWSRLNKWLHERGRVVQPYEGTLLIVDEAQRAKSSDAAVTKRTHELSVLTRGRGGRVWLLSGTPLKNNIEELWTVLQVAGLGTDEWDRETHSPLAARGQFGIDLGIPGRIPERLRNVSLRRNIDDVIPDLPEVQWESIECPLDPDTSKLADQVVLGLRAVGVDIETATLEAISSATMTAIPREMWSRLRSMLAAAKVPVLLDMAQDLKDSGVGVVVFCDHIAPLGVLLQRKRWGRVTGAESAEEKARVVEQAQAGELDGVAVSIRAGGTGVTLTHFRRSLWVDLPTVPADLEQGAARIRRIGSAPGGTPILHTRLVADHVLERRIDALLERKRKLFAATVGASAVRPGEAV